MENIDLQIPETPEVELVPASVGKRFANYLIDVIVFSFFLYFLLVLLAPVYPLATKLIAQQPVSLTEQLMVSFIYGLYMSVMEALLKGKTIGKLITGTRAVSETGFPITTQTAFVRGLMRIIPFEQISAVSLSFEPLSLRPPYPWHDRWSASIVIDEAKSMVPKK